MEGFVYVSEMYDYREGKMRSESKLREEPIMPWKIKNELLFVDFDFTF